MKLTTSIVKSIASRNVWSSDWVAPFCDAILFYKKGMYSHTHPEWRENEKAILQELDLSLRTVPIPDGTHRQYKNYTTPIRITLIKVTERGWYQAMKRKAILIAIEQKCIILGSSQNAIAIMGNIDKVKTVPSWQNDFWNEKQIWNSILTPDTSEQMGVIGNMQTTTIYPEKGQVFLEVLYAED